ncbi:AsmA family protein [Elioraea tepidiphila]|uniref:AsmA family protein n=1 Tax=Elioraea tepidiphila TaxID=457934 RepID=UPI00037B6278|nr:AsmA family protein [Elioraea tepidiphila]
MRILRYTLIGLGVVLLLAVAAVAIFLATFDPESYKPRIQEAAKQATGRDLVLAGPIRLRPSLRPTLQVERVAFANASWGSRPEMAKLASMEVALSVLPLIRGEIAVDRIVLVEPDILLETDAQGRANWDLRPAPGAPPEPPPASGQPPAERRAPPQVAVGELRIERGTVAFRDGRTGETITLAIPRLEAAVPAGQPMRLDLEAALDGTAFTVAGTAGPLARLLDPAARTPFPVDLTVALAGARVGLKGTITEPTAGKGYDMTVEATVPDLARLAALVPGAPPVPPLRGIEVSVAARDSGAPIPELRAIRLALAESDLSALVPGVTVRRIEIAAPDVDAPIRLAGEALVNQTPARVEGTLGPLAALMPGAAARASWPIDVTLAAAGAQAAIKGQVVNPASPAPTADVALDVRVPDLAALSRLAGTALPPLKEIAVSGRVRGPGDRGQVTLADMALKAAGSDLGGTVTVTPAPRMRVEARLQGQLVDADALMAALGGEPAPAAAPAASTAPAARPAQARQRLIPDDPLPLDALREADASVRLQLATLRLGGAEYREIAGTLALDRGNLRLDPLNATVPGGAVTLRLTLDASRPEPPVHIQLSAPSMELRQLLATYGGGYRVGGRVELDADLRGTGSTPHRIASTLDGHLGLAGANLDIDNRLIDLIAGELWRALVPGAPRDGVSNVRCLAIRFDSAAGVATARAFLFDSNLAKVAGSGTMNLGPETLALRMLPTLKIAGGGIAVPVNVRGTFLNPSIRPDAAGAVGALGQMGAGAAAGAQAGAVAGPLGAIVGGVVGAARGGAATDDCPAQLAIARGGRQGATPAAETAPAQQEQPQQAPAQPPQQQPQQQRPASPLQQILPRLGR